MFKSVVIARIIGRFIFVRGIIALLILSVAEAQVPLAIEQYIQDSNISKNNMSIWVAPVQKGSQPLLQLNSQVMRSPASVTKVITTGVGLQLLGGNYRWRTAFYTNGQIRDGVLHGDLLIKGYGNPYFVEERLIEMIAALRGKGIQRIAGEVILDGSYFAENHQNAADFDGQGTEPYNALPSALSINFRTAKLLISSENNRAVVTTRPKLTRTIIENDLRINRVKKCRGKGFAPKISVDYQFQVVRVSGSISANCREKALTKVLGSAGELLYGYFRQFWLQSGGELSNYWRYGHLSKGMKLLLETESKSLSEQIRAMNKHSNNLMTRQLFLTLGAVSKKAPATLAKSRELVKEQLHKMGVPTQDLWIDNGSGLSRMTRMSAEQIGRFLQAMQSSKVGYAFEESLAIAGVDGTMRRRLRGTPLAGKVKAKTGTLDGVKSIAGYLTASSGNQYVFAILVEDVAARRSGALMDKILQWVYLH